MNMSMNNNYGLIHSKIIEMSGDLGNYKKIDPKSWIDMNTGEIVCRDTLDPFLEIEIPKEKYFLLLMRDPYMSWDQGEEVSKEHLSEIVLGSKENPKRNYRNCNVFFNNGNGWIHYDSKIYLPDHDVLAGGLNCLEYRELTKEEYLKIKDLLIKKIDVNNSEPNINIKIK